LPTLGLSHIAEEADGLWARQVPLVLAGHTHGGQVTLARLHELALGVIAGHKYVHGLYGTRGKAGAHPLPSAPSGTTAVMTHASGGHANKPATRERGTKTPAPGVPIHVGHARPAGAVYVGAGIGAAIVPLRLGERGKRELTIFELGQEPGTFEEHHPEQAALPGRKPTLAKTARRAAAVARKKQRRDRRALDGR
jgi:hypothetical protein